jgi:prohibitin 2
MKPSINLFALMALALSMPLLTGCATVGPGEVGIKSEFGKLKLETFESGLHNYNPFTEHFEVINVQRQTIDSKDAENSLSDNPSTKDQMPIKIRFSVIYQTPKDKVLHLKQTVKGDPFEALVAPRVNEAIRAVVAGYNSDQVTLKGQEIQHRVATMANELVGDDITITDTPITHIELPAQIRNAVIQKQNMEVAAKQKQFELDKERIEAEITVVKGEADATAMRVKAAAMKASPELVKMRLADAKVIEANAEFERSQKWDGHLPTTMLGGNTLFNLK